MLAVVIIAFSFTGCGDKKNNSNQDTTLDSYETVKSDYNMLLRKYDKLNEKYNKIKSSADAHTDSEIVTTVIKSTFVKMSLKLSATSTEDYIDDIALVSEVKNSLNKLIVDNKTKVNSLKASNNIYYSYTMYKDDNSLMTFDVYPNDRIIFNDAPKTVFYCENIAKIGVAYFGEEDYEELPNMSLYQKMYLSDICYIDGKLQSEDVVKKISTELDSFVKDGELDQVDDLAVDTLKVIEFRFQGNLYTINLYDKYISILEDESDHFYRLKRKVIF
ncbi:MAG: hypothetical protein K5656_02675 [Lachnospiraceae bacterium]|nr:hypothetical protein [Lachnospiraceae bacterium]